MHSIGNALINTSNFWTGKIKPVLNVMLKFNEVGVVVI